jgi:hypothetical protein
MKESRSKVQSVEVLLVRILIIFGEIVTLIETRKSTMWYVYDAILLAVHEYE